MPERDLFQLMEMPASALLRRQPKQKKNGYAAAPGTGPAGETCKTCDHLVKKVLSRPYNKCALMSAHWTGSYGTDVLARAPACRRWQAKTE